ncbi:acyltransferase [Calothrix sp. NIES-3974]|uniref:acyltransferase n=1 Tax=Calothrix sp. NIES-3974 TaxID=2005462 RepID=UPI000B60C8C4|nr:acyltransferase [Calothrix sp. NIES-3974]BAZ03789.1 putative acetyl transferase [Calothrix sp. NIES-3974]
MNGRITNKKIHRLLEFILLNLLSGIPTRIIGSHLRVWFYRLIFRRIGKNTWIQHNVDFMNTSAIELGDGVQILRNVNVNAIGDNNRVIFEDGVQIQYGVDIRALDNTYFFIDKDTYIGPYVCFAGPGNIRIGKSCLIAAHTGIHANNHNFADPTVDIASQGVTRKGIVIGDDCWLGHGVTVIDGVTIGKGCVIGAGSVVTRDIPPYSVAVGVPAKVIRQRKPTLNQSEEVQQRERIEMEQLMRIERISSR